MDDCLGIHRCPVGEDFYGKLEGCCGYLVVLLGCTVLHNFGLLSEIGCTEHLCFLHSFLIAFLRMGLCSP